MNLVIDDAVEVKQATKEEGESRRSLGTPKGFKHIQAELSKLTYE